MVFSSVLFLCVFLPILLSVYYIVPSRFRNLVALGGSLLFYAWGAPQFVFVLVASSYLDYVCSRLLAKWRYAIRGRMILALASTVNLGVFLYAKYMNFFVEQINHLFQLAGHQPIAWTAVIMPIGISFFTFQKLSYLVDVYRKTTEPANSFSSYLLYVSLFPQLIAGPIVRYHDVAQQLTQRSYCDEQFLVGVWRFSVGLAKKVLIANTLAVVAETAFGETQATAANPYLLSCPAAWAAALCYTMQLYFDFSGYSDMAIGLGKMLGFNFLENFNYPYISRSITEFWRRWHISLSNWMREYLYVPLGGNRVASWRVYVNLWIVFLLSGFWHGASWNFIAWGALHGAMLTAERFAKNRNWSKLPAALALPRTFLLVLIAWVFFRAWDLRQAVAYLSVMFVPATRSSTVMLSTIMSPRLYIVLAIAILFSLTPLWSRADGWLKDWTVPQNGKNEKLQLFLRATFCTTLLVVSFATLVLSPFSPFIYFRF